MVISVSKHIHKALAVSGFWIQAFVIGLSLPAFSESTSSVETKPALTKAVQVLRLTSDQAKSNLSVRIQGVVTCYDHGNILFVQDETVGIFVYHEGDRLSLPPGQK